MEEDKAGIHGSEAAIHDSDWYKVRFTALSRSAPGMVATKIEKCDQLEHGLHPSIQNGLSVEIYIDYSKLVATDLRIEAEDDKKQKIYDKNNLKGNIGSSGQN